MKAILTKLNNPFQSKGVVLTLGNLRAVGNSFDQAVELLEDGLNRMCFEAEVKPNFTLTKLEDGVEVTFHNKNSVNYLLLGV